MSDVSRYLHEQTTAAQAKYAYFLLAAAASAIAVVVNQTREATLAYLQLPLGAAVLCWILSFWFGCRRIGSMTAALRANTAMVLVQSREHPDIPNHPEAWQIALDETRKAANDHASDAGKNANKQFRYLVAGAVFYLLWHVAAMAARTPGLAVRMPWWLGAGLAP